MLESVPAKCRLCSNWNIENQKCNVYDELLGEGTRESVSECASFYDRDQTSDLKLLAKYIDEDPDQVVESRLNQVVSKIITGYEEKFKIMVVGIARRKIKSMIQMVDVIDILLNKLTDRETIDNMTPGQTLRLLSELNNSINTDLTFIMKLVNPDTKLHDLQMWVDARSVINVNGASKDTEAKSEEILNLTNVSRDKIRDAFSALLSKIPEEGDLQDEYERTEEDKEELEGI